jgi:hypothetical protein
MDGSEDGPSRTGQIPPVLAFVGPLAPSTRIQRRRGEEYQEFAPPVCYQRLGRPDRGVRRSRFKGS